MSLKQWFKKETTMDDDSTSTGQITVDKSGEHLPMTDQQFVAEPSEDRIRADRQAGMDAGNAQPLPLLEAPRLTPQQIDVEQERRWRSEGVPPVRPGRQPAPISMVPAARVPCQHCDGRGFMPGINDYLTESIGILGDAGDDVVRTFYTALFRENPGLEKLFPGDPRDGDFGTDHRGAHQRELLLNALGALAELFDPGDPERMRTLDAALQRYGRAHASFTRPDGTVRGATFEEYAAVKAALFATLVRAAADKWKPEYTEAWSQAYDYAAAAMLVEQFRSGFTAPRFVRGGAVR